MALLGFLLTIGILVVIHEFGHYLFARLFKVKVITFSIGFGPKIISWQGRHNRWQLSAIPLGGYVQMLDEREADVPAQLRHAAFNNKPPYQKLLIAFAGPLFNILFAFIAYYGMGIYGVYNLKPVITSLNPSLLVSNIGNIIPDSTINSINNIKIDSWDKAEKTFAKTANTTGVINLNLTSKNYNYEVNLDINRFKHNDNNLSLVGIGLLPFNYLPIIAYIEPQSASTQAGLRQEDQIIKINGTPISNWFQLSTIIRNSPSKKLLFTVKRNQQLIDLPVIPYSATDDNGQIIGRLGIIPTLDNKLAKQNSFIKHYNPLTSLGYAYNSCLDMTLGNLNMLRLMLNGTISWHNIGGPVSIARASSKAINDGIKPFIDFLALISLSLAIMNLLPIPVLDGGHILLYAVEWIAGKPLGISTQQLLFKFGLIIVLGITFLALYNDFLKLFNL